MTVWRRCGRSLPRERTDDDLPLLQSSAEPSDRALRHAGMWKLCAGQGAIMTNQLTLDARETSLIFPRTKCHGAALPNNWEMTR